MVRHQKACSVWGLRFRAQAAGFLKLSLRRKRRHGLGFKLRPVDFGFRV